MSKGFAKHSDRMASLQIDRDPLLAPYRSVIRRRHLKMLETERRILGDAADLQAFSSGHTFFGLHFSNGQWVLREWVPNASAVFLIGEMTDWREDPNFELKRISENGDWEIRMPGSTLAHGDLYRLCVHWSGGSGDRIPAWSRRVVQNPDTKIFNAQVWHPPKPYHWRHSGPVEKKAFPLIYEAHIGMAQDAERVGTYEEFEKTVLPRIVDAGYNTLQLMALQEHPYYASFGYQVSSFFAASSRFGNPEELKSLIDAAHEAGLSVIMDLIHSHAVANEVEGIARFDGTAHQFFHAGKRGRHPAWDSRCFDYGKPQVIHFLLSNCRFWLDEYRVDGFRFDGVTSMLFIHHGLETAFTSYDDYFDDSVDEDALVYLELANRLIHDLRPNAVTLAEDVSGMPGLASPIAEGGFGFDYRFAMGVPDYWIRLTKDTEDERWPMGHLWYELTNRRLEEKTVSYAESHDQALVGDQTLIFRLLGADIYHHMQAQDGHLRVDRGVALHKMIRLATLATAGAGYLNFMGNEFGHPEWIDFPREGNNWSHQYACRKWHLADDPNLKYRYLAAFDRAMITLAKNRRLLASADIRLCFLHEEDKVIAFERAGLLFVFNFHPNRSFTDYEFECPQGVWHLILDSDAIAFGGHGRLKEHQEHHCPANRDRKESASTISLYLPSRTAIVLER